AAAASDHLRRGCARRGCESVRLLLDVRARTVSAGVGADWLARAERDGQRDDGGAAAFWATRSHRAFTVYTVAAAAARAAHRAACFESARKTRRVNKPLSAKYSHKYHAHNGRTTTRRSAFMHIQMTH
ncbi:MAG: hypothetical protein ABGW95_00465, partial [Candidatus Poseidoniia archaeon]